MSKKFQKTNLVPRLFLALLLIAISLQVAGLLFLIGNPNIAKASEPIKMNLQVPIPKIGGGETKIDIKFDGTTRPIADYIVSVYNYAVGIVGILAAVVMMIGGLMWITAGGNTSNIGEAKAMITASLTGLVLVLTSYLILSNVNPALVNLESSVITPANVTPYVVAAAPICKWTEDVFEGDAEAGFLSYCPEADTKKAANESLCGEGKKKGFSCCCPPAPTFDTFKYQGNIGQQKPHADQSLKSTLNCLGGKLSGVNVEISSISDNHLLNNDWSYCTSAYPVQCAGDNDDGKKCCYHTKNSCHYGGGNSTKSYAADLVGDKGNIEVIARKYQSECGIGYILNEGDHIHISTTKCPNN